MNLTNNNNNSDYACALFPSYCRIEIKEIKAKNEETASKEIEIKTNRMFNVVLDVDDVLVTLSAWPHLSGLELTYKQVASFFMRKGAILKAANITHYVFPGVPEFTKLLAKTHDILLSIFSSADKSRNEPFTAALLTKALGEKEYQAKKDYVQVFSANHLTRYKKKLSAVLNDIKDSVLIDNDLTNRAEDKDGRLIEENHFLYAPETFTKDFLRLEFKKDKYDGNGERDLKCILYADFNNRKRNIVVQYKGSQKLENFSSWEEYEKQEKELVVNF